jgi:Transposase and inactivated derivatives
MSQSLSKLYVHIIFHVKNDSTLVAEEDRTKLYAYIGSVLNSNDSSPILINGVCDHVHILCVASKNIALSKLVEEVKKNSSRWIKTESVRYEKFAWQGGYGCFSVSPSLLDKNKQYIANQEIHHEKISFKDEYISFLKEYGIEYNEKFLWTN